MRLQLLACLLPLIATPALASTTQNTFVGNYECNGIVRELMLDLESSDDNTGVTGTFSFSGGGVAGAYTMRGQLDLATGRLTLDPDEWLSRPEGFSMVGLDGTVDGAQISGAVRANVCGAFEATLWAGPGLAASIPATQNANPSLVENVPQGSPLATFDALAAQNPASIPGQIEFPYLGNWAVDIPGGAGIWTSDTEIYLAQQLAVTTHELSIGPAASDAGVVQIAEDGTYRLAWLTGKWQGRWEPNDDVRFPNSILLHHPTDPEDDWIIFRDEEGEMQAREYPYGGLASNRLRPIGTAALAEYLLAVQDPSSLVGEWILYPPYDLTDAQGRLSIDPSGQFAIEDQLLNRSASGTWAVDEEMLVLAGGAWGDGDAYVKFGEPGQAIVVAGGSDWVARRP